MNGVVEKTTVLGTDAPSSKPQHMGNGSPNEIQVEGKDEKVTTISLIAADICDFFLFFLTCYTHALLMSFSFHHKLKERKESREGTV